jgi:hypothetical protein
MSDSLSQLQVRVGACCSRYIPFKLGLSLHRDRGKPSETTQNPFFVGIRKVCAKPQTTLSALHAEPRETQSTTITSTTIANTTAYTIATLTNGQKYYFAVSAINGVGEGAKSNEVSAIPTGEQRQQPGKTPGFDVLVGICAIAGSMAVIALRQRKYR